MSSRTRLLAASQLADEVSVRDLGWHRLVTLTGTGGVGKTRLSLAAAASLDQAFPPGVFFVPACSSQPSWSRIWREESQPGP